MFSFRPNNIWNLIMYSDLYAACWIHFSCLLRVVIRFAEGTLTYSYIFTIGQYLLLKISNGTESRLTQIGCCERNQ
jgi:hypothetical protein